MSGESMIWVGVSLAGVCGSALCSGMEIGYYSLNRLRLRVNAARGDRSARSLAALLERPDRMLTGLLIGNNICNYFGALGVTALLTQAGVSEAMVVVVSAAVVTPLLLIFAEALPKDFFRLEADVLVPRLAPALRAWLALLTATGLPALLSVVATGIGRLAGVSRAEVARDARTRLAALLKEGASHGLLSPAQTTLVDRAMVFSRATVADEMTPWSAAGPLRASARARDAAHRAGGSWAPVIDQGGQAIGVVSRLDLLLEGGTVRDAARPLVRIDAEARLSDAAAALSEAGVAMGVIFRAGRPAGVVTLDDLAEPLTGDLAAW